MGFGGSLICSFMILTILSNNLPVSVNSQFPPLGAPEGVPEEAPVGAPEGVPVGAPEEAPVGAPEIVPNATCGSAASIVQVNMVSRYLGNQNIVPAILKLHYSDCFVEGCDGSVLISGPNTERTADGNRNLTGFQVIEDIKRQVEVVCRGRVSCADILALAAREAVVLASGPRWDVQMGRLDGRVSLAENVKNLPSSNDNVTVLLNNFAAFGLNYAQDFVTMIGGGPKIEKPACSYMIELIYKKTQSNNARPLLLYLEKQFVTQLRELCFIYYLVDTPQIHIFRDGDAVLKTDLSLLTDRNFYNVFRKFVTTDMFKTKFARAMNKMSAIALKTTRDGEIRRTCQL